MSVNDLLFRLKLDPGQFSKSLKDMATGVDNLSKKKLNSLQHNLQSTDTKAAGVKRQIDLMGDAVTKADKKKMTRLEGELKDLETAAKRTKKEIDKVSGSVSKASRMGDKLRGGALGAASGLNGALKGGGYAAGQALSHLPGAGLAAGIAGGVGAMGLTGGAMLAGGAVLGGGLAVGAGALALGKFAKGGVSAARDGRRIDTSLKQQLDAQGQGGRFDELNDLSGTIQSAMNLDDEATREGFTEFLKRGFNVDDLKKNASLIGDIAKDKQIDYKSAAELVAKGLSGEGRAMKELGLASSGDREKDAANFHAQAQGKYGGAGARLAKAEGPGAALSLAIDDAQQTLGDNLIPVIDGLLGRMMNIFNRWQSDGTLDSIIEGMTVVCDMAIQTVGIVAEAGAAIVDFFMNVDWGSWFIAVGNTLWQTLATVGELVWEFIKFNGKLAVNALVAIPQIFISVIETVWNYIVALGKSAWGVITNAIPTALAMAKAGLLEMLNNVPGLDYLIDDDDVEAAKNNAADAVLKIGEAAANPFAEATEKTGEDWARNMAPIGGGISDAAGTFGKSVSAMGDRRWDSVAKGFDDSVADRAVGAASSAQSAQAELYNMGGYSGASQLARQDNAFKAEKAAGKGKGNDKLAQAVDKYNGGRAQNIRITSADGRINPVGVY